MEQNPKQPHCNHVNLSIDVAIFGAFLIAMAPRLSGNTIHEWLSIAFGAAIVIHLLLHWQWLVAVTKRFFGKEPWLVQINYLLNSLLFIDMTLIIFTGLMISEAALPLLGIHVAPGGMWRRLHSLSANVAVFLVGLHTAFHWQWIVGSVKRKFINSRARQQQGLRMPQPRQEV